jgi:preprotein translocase subunit SecD
MRRHIIFLVLTVGIIIGTFVVTLAGDARPQLGLDLQGGISITLFPVQGSDLSTLPTAAEIIRNRIDGLGVAEPDVSQSGGTIVVDLPGLKNPQDALCLVGETAELRFREVLGELPYSSTPTTTPTTAPSGKVNGSTTTSPKSATTAPAPSTTKKSLGAGPRPTDAVETAVHRPAAGASTTTGPTTTGPPAATGSTTTTTAPSSKATAAASCLSSSGSSSSSSTTTVPSSTTAPAPPTTKKSLGAGPRPTDAVETAVHRPAAGTATTVPSTPTTAKATTPTTAAPTGPTSCEDGALVTPPEQNTAAAQEVILPERPAKPGQTPTICYVLGPTLMTGKDVGSATASVDPTTASWIVQVHFKNNDFVTKVATPYVGKQVAITLDQEVVSAPTINQGITGQDVQITGNFSSHDANQLALALRYGSLPIQFDSHQQTVETVSPTLGRDQLHAGLVAGAIGLLLVAIYMILFYRLLGLVVWVGIGLTGMTFFTLITWLSTHRGLTLTLAGVTGIIVSVGVTVDSYVVYFERLKDEVRTGKTVRSSLDSGFRRAFRTIVAADLVSIIVALVLYFFATGSVRGFAYFLALSTILDLILAYCFMYPAVSLLARNPKLVQMPGVGIAAGLDVPGVRA